MRKNTRIHEKLISEIIAEAAKLHARSNQEYSIEELEQICMEAKIPPHLVQEALRNIEIRNSEHRRKKREAHQRRIKLLKQFSHFMIKMIRLSCLFMIPSVSLFVFGVFRPQVKLMKGHLLTKVIPPPDSSQVTEVKRDKLAARRSEQNQQELNSRQVELLKSNLSSIKEELRTLKSQHQVLKDQLSSPPPPEPGPVAPKPMETGGILRQQFRMRIMGKNPQQVLASVGKPEHTSERRTFTVWYYNNIQDEITGTVGSASVYFYEGVVGEITFS